MLYCGTKNNKGLHTARIYTTISLHDVIFLTERNKKGECFLRGIDNKMKGGNKRVGRF